MTSLVRPLSMTSARQTLTFPVAGYAQSVQAYLWGAGGGAGGNDGANPGGAGTAGGYVNAEFTVNPGDVVEITVGSGGWSGRASSAVNDYTNTIFNSRTAVPQNSETVLPVASATYVTRWNQLLNQTGVWNTGTAVDGSVTNIAHTLTFDQTWTVFFPFSIDYLFSCAAYYQATVYIDGVPLFATGLGSWRTQESGGFKFIATVTPGNHDIRVVAQANPGAFYGVFGVGLTIATTLSAGSGGYGLVRTVFDTRNTPASPPLTVPDPLVLPAGLGYYSNLMADYSMWEADPRASSCSRTYANVWFPYTGSYQIEMSAANTATLSIDDVPVYTTPTLTSYNTAYTIDHVVTQGYHTVSFTAALTDPTIIGGVAIIISKSWSGATGGLAGPVGSSGGGGGSGGATTLVLNPYTTNETLIAVAVGGAGGGGAGAGAAGQADATAPGPRGQTAAGVSSGQTGQNQGDLYKDGGGGGAGGPGGPGGAGRNGYSSVGDSYGQAGCLGQSYLNPVATGVAVDPTNHTVPVVNSYYYLNPNAGFGALPGHLQGGAGSAVLVCTSFGPRIKDGDVWRDVETIYVNLHGQWKRVDGMYVNSNGAWAPVVGTFALTFQSQADDFASVARPADHRPIPDPPPPPPPTIYTSERRGPGFNAGTCSNSGSASCSAGGGGGGKIICTKLYELGLMSQDIYLADQAFGADLVSRRPDVYNGYRAWAEIVVDWMEGQGPKIMPWMTDEKFSAAVTKWSVAWAKDIATPWAEEMAYQVGRRSHSNRTGRWIMAAGMPICKAVGVWQRWFGASKKPAGFGKGLMLIPVFVLFKLIAELGKLLDRK